MGDPPGSRFLGLPVELRREIFLHVLAAELWRPLEGHPTDIWGLRHGPEHDSTGDFESRYVIPWLSLMLTCKPFAQEVRSIMNETAFLQDAHNLTYELHAGPPGDPTRSGGFDHELGGVRWRRLPCAPAQARYLVLSIDPRIATRRKPDNRPSDLTRILYQILNFHLFRHRGSRYGVVRALLEQVHLRELLVVLENPGEPRSPSMNYLQRAILQMSAAIGALVRRDVAQDFHKIRLTFEGKGFAWTVTPVGDPDEDSTRIYGSASIEEL